MQLLAGTSGFSYPEWCGSFYPEKTKPPEMLAYYASRLPSVEINNTFYRMPRPSMLSGWHTAVPPHFLFVLKASRRITHQKRLRDCADPLEYLCRTATSLKDKLGPLLFQLPPQLQKDAPLLADFVALLPSGIQAAFEFRHPSWFADDVYDVLAKADAALTAGDLDDAERSPPLEPTASWGFLRLRRSDYSDDELRGWAARLAAQPWSRAFAFFKHETRGPELAERLNQLVNHRQPGPKKAARGRPGLTKSAKRAPARKKLG